MPTFSDTSNPVARADNILLGRQQELWLWVDSHWKLSKTAGAFGESLFVTENFTYTMSRALPKGVFFILTYTGVCLTLRIEEQRTGCFGHNLPTCIDLTKN
jgi:hypothetical protein